MDRVFFIILGFFVAFITYLLIIFLSFGKNNKLSKKQIIIFSLIVTAIGTFFSQFCIRFGWGIPWWSYHIVAILVSFILPLIYFKSNFSQILLFMFIFIPLFFISQILYAYLENGLSVNLINNIARTKSFENGNLLNWGCELPKKYSAKIVNYPVNHGKHAVKMELRHGDPKFNLGHRAELNDLHFKAPFNKNIWYRFNVFIPTSWPNEDIRCLIAQWHSMPDWFLGEVLRSPALGIEYRNKSFKIRICYNENKIQRDNYPESNHMTVLYESDAYASKGE